MFPPGIERSQAHEIQLKQTGNFVLRNEMCVLCAFSDYKYKDISARCLNSFPEMNHICNKNILSYASDTKAVTLSCISLCILNINLTNWSFRIHVIYHSIQLRSVPPPGRFTSGKDSVPIVQGVGWAPGPVWTCAKNFAPADSIQLLIKNIFVFLLELKFVFLTL
jgi:hypothetical protein